MQGKDHFLLGAGREPGHWRSIGESVFFVPNRLLNETKTPTKRKNKVKKLVFEMLSAFVVGAVGCALLFNGCIFDNRPTLHVYNWSDYIAPDLIAKFEKDNGCKVCIDTFDDNESMLAKMQAGATGYDVIFPSSYVVPVLKKHKLIQKLDMTKMPNVSANFDDKFKDALHEDSFTYSVPYAFSMTGIAFRKDKVELTDQQKNGDFSWSFMIAQGMKGKTCIMNDIREVIGVGLKMNGCSANSTKEEDIKKAVDAAGVLKKCARRMDSVEYRVGLVNGVFYAAMAYNSDIFQVVQENPDIPVEFVIPNEGSNSSWDEMCITSTSEQVDLAHKFINFLYDAEVAAENIEYVGSAMPNKAMIPLLPDEIRNNPMVNVPQDILNRVELIRDVGDAISYYNKAWDAFLSIH